jgi:hypothetical protein
MTLGTDRWEKDTLGEGCTVLGCQVKIEVPPVFISLSTARVLSSGLEPAGNATSRGQSVDFTLRACASQIGIGSRGDLGLARKLRE